MTRKFKLSITIVTGMLETISAETLGHFSHPDGAENFAANHFTNMLGGDLRGTPFTIGETYKIDNRLIIYKLEPQTKSFYWL